MPDDNSRSLRLSSYTILSDRLRNGGYAVFNGLTGTIDMVNENLMRAFQSIIKNKPPQDRFIESDLLPPDILSSFLNRGHITELSHAAEREYARSVSQITHEYASKQPSIVIVPDLDCNYRCVYCFERSLQSGLKGRKTKMDMATVDHVFQSIKEIGSDIGLSGQTISLFGGEPMQASNLQIVEYIVSLGRSLGCSFAATTNGHDLDAFIPLLGSEQIETVQITVDGPPAIHDKRRIALDGSSSFERIVANVQRVLKDSDVLITLRVNLDDQNYPYFNDLLDICDKQGWLADERILVNAALVDQKDARGKVVPLLDINNVRNDLSQLVDQYPSLKIGSQQENLRNDVFTTLLSKQAFMPRSCYCSASCGSYVFLPDGTISSCWESVGEECSYIGKYSEQGLLLDQEKAAYHFGRSVDRIDACLDCQYCLVCGGGCAQMAETNCGDLYQPYCGDLKETFPWVLAEAVDGFLRLQGL
ncbi:MAG: SPASM domain-containing protein [Coriobacteriia bacterium]|nr:SPASM domain-containing protein [Coriobacteriia bacterium]